MPPVKGASYPVFVPKTDADGRDVAGLRLPTLEAPAATHTGWNLRKAGFGEGELCENNGAMIPFAATREERLKNNDPRLSMAERYPNEGDRIAASRKRPATGAGPAVAGRRRQAVRSERQTSMNGATCYSVRKRKIKPKTHKGEDHADATRYSARLHRRRNHHAQPNRFCDSGAASDAGEFRHSRRRLRLPHPHFTAIPPNFHSSPGGSTPRNRRRPKRCLPLHKALHLERVVIVTPSVYGTDNSATLFGMKARGATARGVAVVDDKTPDGDLEAMNQAGIRGIRLNLATGGVNDPNVGRPRFQAAVDRVKARGWHIQLFTSLAMISAIKDLVAASPVPVVFDHFGGAQAELGVDQPGFADLVELVRTGRRM